MNGRHELRMSGHGPQLKKLRDVQCEVILRHSVSMHSETALPMAPGENLVSMHMQYTVILQQGLKAAQLSSSHNMWRTVIPSLLRNSGMFLEQPW